MTALRRVVPDRPDPVTVDLDSERGRRLHTLLAPRLRAGEEILALRLRPSGYASTHRLATLDVDLAERRLSFVLKGCGRAAAACARVSRPAFTVDGDREPWAYETVLPKTGLTAPGLLGRLSGGGEASDHLLLERTEGVELYQLGRPAAWMAAARWLARLHDRGGRLLPDFGKSGRLLAQDSALHLRWLARARRYAVQKNRIDRVRVLERLAGPYRKAVARLASLPKTLLHGEFYPSNIMVDVRVRPPRVETIDWETVGSGPGVLDVAALTSGAWDESARASIVAAYRREFARLSGTSGNGKVPPGLDPMSLASGRMVVAMQWLGWSPAWTPPPEHVNDWEGEALRAAAWLQP